VADERSQETDEPHWPTVEEQLAAAKVVHGTALEKLIIENQDFSLLGAEEAHDRLRLPPWLRVYWRKQHPEMTASAGDPTGGYPLALRDLYMWMTTHQDLKPEPATGDAQQTQA
jgi:hypothetical protein